MEELTAQDLDACVALRRALHQAPELSGEEEGAARLTAGFLAPTRPDTLLTGLGGHGVAAVYEGAEPGPTVLFRAELDALPIEQTSAAPWRSRAPGKAHLCGHDGHAATLAAMGLALGRRRPARGRAVLLFQPAEETGAGAAAVIADPRFAGIAPDASYAWHNWPGLPLGVAALAAGPVHCASRGLKIVLTGRTAHAAEPETARSPLEACARLALALKALGPGGALTPDFRLVTVTHLRLGEPSFGVTPGEAEIRATLRTLTDDQMEALLGQALALAEREAQAGGFGLAVSHHDVFAHVENHPEAVADLAAALDAQGLARVATGLPMRASEDFGRFGHGAPAAMVFIGAGEAAPRLHHPDYDFPESLIGLVAPAMLRVARAKLG